MAAGSLLSDLGAGRSLDLGAWSAAYSYYGPDLFGITYADEVLARAVAWQRDGFCSSCALDEGLVADFEAAYGASVRRQLIGADRRRKKKDKHREVGRDRKGDRRDPPGRRTEGDRGSRYRVPRRPPASVQRPSKPPSAKKDRPAKPSPLPSPRKDPPIKPPPPPPSTPPPTTPPPAGECDPIRKLLGC